MSRLDFKNYFRYIKVRPEDYTGLCTVPPLLSFPATLDHMQAVINRSGLHHHQCTIHLNSMHKSLPLLGFISLDADTIILFGIALEPHKTAYTESWYPLHWIVLPTYQNACNAFYEANALYVIKCSTSIHPKHINNPIYIPPNIVRAHKAP